MLHNIVCMYFCNPAFQLQC